MKLGLGLRPTGPLTLTRRNARFRRWLSAPWPAVTARCVRRCLAAVLWSHVPNFKCNVCLMARVVSVRWWMERRVERRQRERAKPRRNLQGGGPEGSG